MFLLLKQTVSLCVTSLHLSFLLVAYELDFSYSLFFLKLATCDVSVIKCEEKRKRRASTKTRHTAAR